MMIRHRGLPKQEQIEVLKSYIGKEVIKEYRKFAEEALDRIQVDIPTKRHQCSALKYPNYSGVKYASQTGQYHY